MAASRSPLLLFAPGAGAPSSSGWMVAWRARLGALGQVETFDYPYQAAGKRRPDPHDLLVASHVREVDRVRALAPEAPLFLLGKSMGSRMGCHASLERPVKALVCFGYPLKSTSGKLRDAVLLELKTPILFLQGTRDPLCPLDELEGVRRKMSAPSELVVVQNGNHSLEVPKRQEPQEAVNARLLEAVRGFLEHA